MFAVVKCLFDVLDFNEPIVSDDYQHLEKHYHAVVKAALAIEAVGETLAVLTELAAVYIDHEAQERAALILAFLVEQPDTPPDVSDIATELLLELESRICPRVIWDAKVRAREVTLEELVGDILEGG